MNTATATKADQLREAQKRLAELQGELRTATQAAQEARAALTRGDGAVEAVTAAEGREGALRGAVEEMRATVERLQRERNAESARDQVLAAADAYREQSREVVASIERYLLHLERARAAVLDLAEEERQLELRRLQLRRLDAPIPTLQPDDEPGRAWESVPGAKQFHKDTGGHLLEVRFPTHS